MKHRKSPRAPRPAQPPSVHVETLPTKPTKAYVSAVITLLGLVGIHVTSGTAQAVVLVAWVLLSWYGVWRARNHPKLPDRGRGVAGFLQ